MNERILEAVPGVTHEEAMKYACEKNGLVYKDGLMYKKGLVYKNGVICSPSSNGAGRTGRTLIAHTALRTKRSAKIPRRAKT
jgi:hypothetical protein